MEGGGQAWKEKTEEVREDMEGGRDGIGLEGKKGLSQRGKERPGRE